MADAPWPKLARRASSATTVVRPNHLTKEDAVNPFVARHASVVTSTLSGFDRLVFRGTLQPLVRDRGMFTFLCHAGIRLLDFKSFVVKTSERLKNASLAVAEKLGRPVR